MTQTRSYYLTDEEQAKIREMHAVKATIADIAKSVRRARETVREFLINAGLHFPRKYKAIRAWGKAPLGMDAEWYTKNNAAFVNAMRAHCPDDYKPTDVGPSRRKLGDVKYVAERSRTDPLFRTSVTNELKRRAEKKRRAMERKAAFVGTAPQPPETPAGKITKNAPPGMRVLLAVAEASGEVTKAQLQGGARDKRTVYWRHIAMHIMQTRLGRNHMQISRVLGDRDHTTIIYGLRKVADNPDKYAKDLARVEALL